MVDETDIGVRVDVIGDAEDGEVDIDDEMDDETVT